MIFLTHVGSRWLSCSMYESQLILHRWGINNSVNIHDSARVLLVHLHKDNTGLASCSDRNTGTLIFLWYTRLLVFKYFSLMLMLRVLMIYYKNKLILMLRISPYAYRHLQDITFYFVSTVVVHCALLLHILSIFSNPWLDCCIAQNLKFAVFAFTCWCKEL